MGIPWIKICVSYYDKNLVRYILDISISSSLSNEVEHLYLYTLLNNKHTKIGALIWLTNEIMGRSQILSE